MNAKNRREVSLLVSKLEQMAAEFEQIKECVQLLADSEREKFDNMSDGLQESEKGQAIDAAASYLEDAANCDDPQDMLDTLGQIEGIA
jgi:hypothetical protein